MNPSGAKDSGNSLKSFDDIVIDLPGGWKKRFSQRKNGASAGKWDAYLHAPNGPKLRSIPDLERYLTSMGISVDRNVINMKRHPLPDWIPNEVKSQISGCLSAPTGCPEGPFHRRRRRRLKAVPNRGKLPPWSHMDDKELSLTQTEERYLKRQYQKLHRDLPKWDQCIYLALQLKKRPMEIKQWFVKHQKHLQAESLSPSREIKSFDALMVEELPVRDLLLGERYIIVQDNAELDVCSVLNVLDANKESEKSSVEDGNLES